MCFALDGHVLYFYFFPVARSKHVPDDLAALLWHALTVVPNIRHFRADLAMELALSPTLAEFQAAINHNRGSASPRATGFTYNGQGMVPRSHFTSPPLPSASLVSARDPHLDAMVLALLKAQGPASRSHTRRPTPAHPPGGPP